MDSLTETEEESLYLKRLHTLAAARPSHVAGYLLIHHFQGGLTEWLIDARRDSQRRQGNLQARLGAEAISAACGI